eukprot:9496380-Pyramimonas_sp.AAC.1
MPSIPREATPNGGPEFGRPASGGGGQNVSPFKLFSHLDVDSHVRSGQGPRCSRGNELADALAQRGAGSAAAPIRTH